MIGRIVLEQILLDGNSLPASAEGEFLVKVVVSVPGGGVRWYGVTYTPLNFMAAGIMAAERVFIDDFAQDQRALNVIVHLVGRALRGEVVDLPKVLGESDEDNC